VMMGRSDRRVLVLEDVGAKDCRGLPQAFSWNTHELDKWFSADNPYEKFLDEFVKVVARYSQQCARRKELWDSDKKQYKETGKPFTDLSQWRCFLELILPNHERLLDMKEQAAAEVKRRNDVSRPAIQHHDDGVPNHERLLHMKEQAAAEAKRRNDVSRPAIQHHDDGVCGIGVVLIQDGPGVFIQTVHTGRGADDARGAGNKKLEPRDRIIQADTVVVTTLAEATKALVGRRDSQVELLIQRKIGKDSFRFYITVTRC
jgi:hypothetical protein